MERINQSSYIYIFIPNTFLAFPKAIILFSSLFFSSLARDNLFHLSCTVI